MSRSRIKKAIASLAVVALAGIANATVVLFPDGDFEDPGNSALNWLEVNCCGTYTYSYPATGGNPNGCGIIDHSANNGGFGIWVANNGNTISLSSLGLTAGQTYTFVQDMKIISGSSIGGLKIESWSNAGNLSNSGDMRPLSGTTSWATYSFSYTINPAATGLKIVPLWGPGSAVAFDNLGVFVPGVTPLSVSITSPTNSQVVYSNFTINATATVSPGTVTNVGFYVDNTLIGNATSSPFGYSASGVSAGLHALKAVARSSSGGAVTSSVVSITVTNAVPPAFGAYESFNYSSLANGTPTTGTGFTGNWTCGAGGTIVSGLTYPSLATANSALQSSSSYQLESLSSVPSGVGTLWVSFIFKQAGDNGGNRDGFVLEDSTGKGVMFAYQQFQATVGQPALTTVSSYSAVGSQLSPRSGNTQTYNTNNFYVLQLTYTGGSLGSVAVYSNPTAGQPAAPAPDFTVTSGLSGIGPLSVLGVVHQAGIPLTVDEIRAGSTFADVVGANLAPTIPTTLALSVAASKKVSWTGYATNYYQPQSSTDAVNWNNLGSLLYGTNVTSVYDLAPVAFYQVQEILPVTAEEITDGGFETDDGFGGALYWPSAGTQLPTRITSDFRTGTACMSLYVTNDTITAQNSDLKQNLLNVGGPGITGGNAYSFSFWAKAFPKNPAGGYVQRYKITWLDAGSAIVGAVGFTDFTGGNGTWAQISTGPVVAPATAVNALIEIFGATGGIAGDFGGVLIDDASLAGTTPTGAINVLTPTIQNGAVFTATVRTNGVTASAALGTISFKTNSVAQSAGTVMNGSADSAPATVPASYTVTAIYSGDATYIGSTTNLVVGSGVNTTPTNIVSSVSGNQLTLSWPADHTGWILQTQTNSASVGLGANWFNVPGSTATNRMTFTIVRANPTVFFRLKY